MVKHTETIRRVKSKVKLYRRENTSTFDIMFQKFYDCDPLNFLSGNTCKSRGPSAFQYEVFLISLFNIIIYLKFLLSYVIGKNVDHSLMPQLSTGFFFWFLFYILILGQKYLRISFCVTTKGALSNENDIAMSLDQG